MHAQPASSRDGRCPTCGNADPFDRSDEAHGHFFAAVKSAYFQWPERAEFQPTSETHLRGWLLVEAGHKLSMDIDGPKNITVATVRLVRELLREQGGSETALVAMRMYQTKTGVRVVVPKSISKSGPKRIGKREFTEVSRKVYEIVEQIVGVPVDQLVKAHVA